MKNWAPLIVVLALIALLVALFGPGIYRGILLKRDVSSLLLAAREGRVADVVALIAPDQQAQISDLLARHLPADYQQSIDSLKMIDWHMEGENDAVTKVLCKIKHDEALGVYQGQLVWHYSGGHWEWDFLASSGAEFTPSGEPAWYSLRDLMPLAEGL